MKRLTIAVLLFAVSTVALATPTDAYLAGLRELAMHSFVTQHDGRIIFHDCDDARLSPAYTAAVRSGVAGRMSVALAPLRREFLMRLRESRPDADLTRAWQNMIETDGLATLTPLAGEIVAAFADGPTPMRSRSARKRCLTGRCDCAACAAGETCDCQRAKYDSLGRVSDCEPPRRSCNVAIIDAVGLDFSREP